MPRRGFIPKREVLPDPVYGTTVVTKLINQIMLDGKRGVAQRVCYDAFDMIQEKTGKEALEVFQAGMNNILPQLEVKARRVGGATYQVPMEIRPERRQTLALRWLVACPSVSPARSWTPRTTPATLSSARKKCTAWRKRTRRSRITAGSPRNLGAVESEALCVCVSSALRFCSGTRHAPFRYRRDAGG